MMAKSRAAQYAINKPSVESWDAILTLSSITPVGMGREANDASDVVIRVAGLWGVGRSRRLYLCSGQWWETDWSFWQSASILFGCETCTPNTVFSSELTARCSAPGPSVGTSPAPLDNSLSLVGRRRWAGGGCNRASFTGSKMVRNKEPRVNSLAY